MITIPAPAHTLPTYTPAVYAHLLSLRRSYEAQRDIAMHRLEECNADGDSDGIHIAQLDMALAMRGLLHVNNHLYPDAGLVHGAPTTSVLLAALPFTASA